MTNAPQHSSSWVNFIYASFAASVLLSAVGIFFLDVPVWPKGYLGMGLVMVVMTSISLTKTIRDKQDAELDRQERAGQR
jgi:hypothetical protein